MNRHKTFLIDSIKEYCFLDSKFVQFKGGEYEVPFETNPTDGEHTLESCKSCQKEWQRLCNELSEKFDKFPNCCKYHSKLNELNIFKKDDFKNIAESTANKIIFTYHHIINNLDEDNWYDDIIDYVLYTFESFGSFPTGYGEPFRRKYYCESVLDLITNIESKITSDSITTIEVKTRINKVKKLFENDTETDSNEDRDFNLLMSKYEEWYKVFPFDLSYFKHLKEKFGKTIPLFTGRTRYNKYLKTTKNEVHTKDSLMVVLLHITKEILTSINGLSLYEKGLITDAEKHQLELIISNRKLELFQLSAMPNNSKQEYIKVLKKWFKEEKEFIKEIKPLLKHKSAGTVRPYSTDIAYFCFYTFESKELQTHNTFPSKKAWKEIANRFGKDDTNIQKAYNIIFKSSFERLKETKTNNIRYVIDNMLTEYPKALEIAKKELIKAK
ncbi:hypothetical protein [Winogradskyella flava]|uniref:hypothetical protein n=1 Tax=Winogradskyella flava TaxID=1884876 RepID=UPI00249151CB|nr:hypothetical protein [Winogradskyella flava]